jgi:dTDP-4-amino-4,6-dideoxygalactose transaminase
MKIPITKPVFGQEELDAVQIPLKKGWVVQGPYVKEFEDKFSAFTGSPFCSATSSCTTALHIAMAILGLKPGDEVIVPAFTWIATPNVVEYMRAKPVFCDIDLKTFNMDVSQLESLITRKTVGILPVHLFGLSADLDPILKIAKRHKLWIVEDAACGFGARYKGKHVGRFGDIGAFSFHPRKAITTGEGGMLTTEDKKIDALSRSLRDHGAAKTDLARHQSKGAFLLTAFNHLGYNYRMTDMQGALGSAQMDRATMIIKSRQVLATYYDHILSDIPWLQIPKVPKGYEHGYQSYVCLFRPELPTAKNLMTLHEKRNALMDRLEQGGISTRQGTHAPVLLDYYTQKYKFRSGRFPNAEAADRLTITLPLYPQMTSEEQDEVAVQLARN